MMQGEVRYIKKYGITLVEDGYYTYTGKYKKLYNIFTADGCCWEKGLTWAGYIMECKEYGELFQKILKHMNKQKGGAVIYES